MPWRPNTPHGAACRSGRQRRRRHPARDSPAATRSATAAASSAGSSRAALGCAADDHRHLAAAHRSPAQAASSASGPRRTSSWVLVSSRQTAAGRSGPNADTASARKSASRCGASKKTIVRGSAASAARALRRRPPLRGGNPSKVNRSLGRPDTASAVVTADGPGRQVTGTPARDRGGHQPVARIGHAGHAGVGHQQYVVAADQGGQQIRGAGTFVALEVGQHPAAAARSRARRSAGAIGGCPRRPRCRPRPERSAAVGWRRRAWPMGRQRPGSSVTAPERSAPDAAGRTAPAPTITG